MGRRSGFGALEGLQGWAGGLERGFQSSEEYGSGKLVETLSFPVWIVFRAGGSLRVL